LVLNEKAKAFLHSPMANAAALPFRFAKWQMIIEQKKRG
jgi:hypothetical protein